MQVEIVNRANLALSYIRESLGQWGDKPNHASVAEVFRKCETIAMENMNMVVFLSQMDAELKMQLTVNETLTNHIDLNGCEEIKFHNHLAINSRRLQKLLNDVKG
jgi:hypothetical protein